jgi:predicted dehydrogenase
MKEDLVMSVPRRHFLRSAAGTLLASPAIALPAFSPGAQSTSANDRLRFGIIGVGMQGSGLLANAITLPGVECVAAADLYDGRHTLAKEITGNPNLPTTRRYHELLERKDIDCFIAAVPDFWHMRVVTDACKAGKDIYCEKPMSHTIEHGFKMVQAAKDNNRVVQIGSQRVSSALCAKARELIQGGAIGDIVMIELSMGRNSPNGAWQYPPPPDASPENLDWDTWLNDAPKIPFDPVRFARWRCWKEYGTGVAGDLMVHLLSGMLYSTSWNEAPRSAYALGGIFRFNDGRNMPDVHTVLFDYHGIPVYVRLDLAGETPELARFIGPKGILEASGEQLVLIPQTGEDRSPSYYAASFPKPLREKYEDEWHAAHPVVLGHEALSDHTVFRGPDWDDVKPHLWNFFQAVRSRKPVAEDAVFGNHAAIACHMANNSYFHKERITFEAKAS